MLFGRFLTIGKSQESVWGVWGETGWLVGIRTLCVVNEGGATLWGKRDTRFSHVLAGVWISGKTCAVVPFRSHASLALVKRSQLILVPFY